MVLSALGEIFRSLGSVVEEVEVKAATAITKGQLVANDGTGFVPATNALAATSQVYVALSEKAAADTDRRLRVAIHGCVVAKKVTGAALKKGQKLVVGAAGACKIAATGEVVFAECFEDTAADDAEVKIRII